MLSCGAPPPRAPVPPAQPIATNVAAPAGVTLAPCVPRGPELCFNATDDDCNGIIDEGCGVHTGPLQFTIAWGSAPADVNLAIVLPTGERIPDGKTKTNEGFTLDRDCPGADRCRDQNVETFTTARAAKTDRHAGTTRSKSDWPTSAARRRRSPSASARASGRGPSASTC
jgi:hypothetical protein